MHEVLLGIGRHLNNATAALETIHSRLEAIEQQTKRRGVGSFTGYLLAVCVGVAGFLAWQSYGEAAKQIIATKAPELGWSPNAKQMIAGWVEQIGWTKPLADAKSGAAQSSAPETPQAAPVVQTASAAVVPIAPVAPSIDPEQVHQIASDVAALRQTVEQLSAGQDQMARVVDRLQGAVAEILVKMPEPPPPPPVAAAVPAPKPKPKPVAPPWSRGPMPPYGPPPYGPPPYGPPPYGPPYQ
jgi:outer membrane murein-binding lipoprotein Lpp